MVKMELKTAGLKKNTLTWEGGGTNNCFVITHNVYEIQSQNWTLNKISTFQGELSPYLPIICLQIV